MPLSVYMHCLSRHSLSLFAGVRYHVNDVSQSPLSSGSNRARKALAKSYSIVFSIPTPRSSRQNVSARSAVLSAEVLVSGEQMIFGGCGNGVAVFCGAVDGVFL